MRVGTSGLTEACCVTCQGQGRPHACTRRVSPGPGPAKRVRRAVWLDSAMTRPRPWGATPDYSPGQQSGHRYKHVKRTRPPSTNHRHRMGCAPPANRYRAHLRAACHTHHTGRRRLRLLPATDGPLIEFTRGCVLAARKHTTGTHVCTTETGMLQDQAPLRTLAPRAAGCHHPESDTSPPTMPKARAQWAGPCTRAKFLHGHTRQAENTCTHQYACAKGLRTPAKASRNGETATGQPMQHASRVDANASAPG